MRSTGLDTRLDPTSPGKLHREAAGPAESNHMTRSQRHYLVKAEPKPRSNDLMKASGVSNHS